MKKYKKFDNDLVGVGWSIMVILFIGGCVIACCAMYAILALEAI